MRACIPFGFVLAVWVFGAALNSVAKDGEVALQVSERPAIPESAAQPFADLLQQLAVYRQDNFWPYRLLSAASVQEDLMLSRGQRQRVAEGSEAFWTYDPEVPEEAIQFDPGPAERLAQVDQEYKEAKERGDTERMRVLSAEAGELVGDVHLAGQRALERRYRLQWQMRRDFALRGLELLLPHQRERLGQVLLYVGLGRGQPLAVYRHPRLLEFVDITEAEQQALAQRAADFAPEFSAQANNLLVRYHRQIQEQLGAERQALRILLPGQPELAPDDPLVERILSYDVFRQVGGVQRGIEDYLNYCVSCARIIPFPTMSVRRELSLTEDQVLDIGLSAAQRDELGRELLNRPRDVLAETMEPDQLMALDDQQLRAKAAQQRAQIDAEHHERVVGMLLPHQRAVFVRMMLEYQGNMQWPFGIYHRAEMAEWFGLTGDQQQQLSQAAERVWPEFYREYTALVDRYENRVREALGPESRQGWEAVFGPPFVLIECGILPPERVAGSGR